MNPSVPDKDIITSPRRGVFRDEATDMILEQWPNSSSEKSTSFTKVAMYRLNSIVIAGIQDAGLVPAHLRLHNQMATNKDWTVPVYAIMERAKRTALFSADSEKSRGSRCDGRLSARSVKLFADGAVVSWGSAMLLPYSDRPESKRSLLIIDLTSQHSLSSGPRQDIR